VHLHRAHADVELIGNQLVGQAGHHQVHHVAFAVGQLAQPLLQAAALAQFGQPLARLGQGLLDAVHQGIVGKRLFAKVEGAAFDGIDRRGHIGMAGEEDDGHGVQAAPRHQQVKQGQAAHAGHAHVQQQAAGLALGRPGLQHGLKGLGTVKRFAGQAARTQQPGQRFAHASVVVNDVHSRVGYGFHGKYQLGGCCVRYAHSNASAARAGNVIF